MLLRGERENTFRMPDSSPRHRTAGLVVGLALAMVASACASGSSGSSGGALPADDRVSSSPEATQAPATGGEGDGKEATSAPAAVPEILDFQAPLVGGGTLEGAELAGAPVAVWFWAPW